MKSKWFWVVIIGGLLIFSLLPPSFSPFSGILGQSTAVATATPIPAEALPGGLPVAVFRMIGALVGFGLTILAALGVRWLVNRIRR